MKWLEHSRALASWAIKHGLDTAFNLPTGNLALHILCFKETMVDISISQKSNTSYDTSWS